MSVVSGASATVVSCSFIGDEKTKETDTTTSHKEVSQGILKNEIQDFLSNQQFDSKDSAITAVQNKKDGKFEGLDSHINQNLKLKTLLNLHLQMLVEFQEFQFHEMYQLHYHIL